MRFSWIHNFISILPVHDVPVHVLCKYKFDYRYYTCRSNLFLSTFSQEDLYKILKAYTIHNPREGYCQAQAPIAAVLLMHMPAEQAFWCFVSICEKYVQGYYSPGLVWSVFKTFINFSRFPCRKFDFFPLKI